MSQCCLLLLEVVEMDGHDAIAQRLQLDLLHLPKSFPLASIGTQFSNNTQIATVEVARSATGRHMLTIVGLMHATTDEN